MTKKNKRKLKQQLDTLAKKHGQNLNSASYLELIETAIQFIENHEQQGRTVKVLGATNGPDFFEFDLKVEDLETEEPGSNFPMVDFIFGKGTFQKILENQRIKNAVIGLNKRLQQGSRVESATEFISLFKELREGLDEISGISQSSRTNFKSLDNAQEITKLLLVIQDAKDVFASTMGVDCDLIHGLVALITREYILICSRLEYKHYQETLTEDDWRMIGRATADFFQIVNQWISEEPSGTGDCHH